MATQELALFLDCKEEGGKENENRTSIKWAKVKQQELDSFSV